MFMFMSACSVRVCVCCVCVNFAPFRPPPKTPACQCVCSVPLIHYSSGLFELASGLTFLKVKSSVLWKRAESNITSRFSL